MTPPTSLNAYRPAAQRSPGHLPGPPGGSYAATSGPPTLRRAGMGKRRYPMRTERPAGHIVGFGERAAQAAQPSTRWFKGVGMTTLLAYSRALRGVRE